MGRLRSASAVADFSILISDCRLGIGFAFDDDGKPQARPAAPTTSRLRLRGRCDAWASTTSTCYTSTVSTLASRSRTRPVPCVS